MVLQLVDEAERQINPLAVKFWVESDGQRISCSITDVALFDDYQQPYEIAPLTVFHANIRDILRRAEEKNQSGLQNESGLLCATTFRGDGILST